MLTKINNLKHLLIKRNFDSAKLAGTLLHDDMRQSATMSELMLLINRLDLQIKHLPLYRDVMSKIQTLLEEVESDRESKG